LARAAIIEELMARAKPLAKHGAIGGGHSRDYNVMSGGQGNRAAYLASRLKRDHPEIAAAVERGLALKP